MRLSELRRALRDYADAFDPALVSARDANRVVDEAAKIEKIAATVKVLAAARVAETEVWRAGGDRSAAHDLARRTGTPVTQARDAIETGRRLQELPAVNRAARRGDLSAQQVSLVADAATADPDAERRLLEASKSGSLGSLREECARTKANVIDREARRRQIHERRQLRTWVDVDGAGHLHIVDNPEKIAEIVTSLAPTRDRLFKKARKQGSREPLDAFAADALHQVVTRRTTGIRTSGTSKMLVRVDLERLVGLARTGQEVCEIAGFGPIAVSAVHEMLETGDPFLAAIVTKGEEVVGVAHLGRKPTAYQRSALEWLYPTCAAEGCNSLTYLEFDHRDDWAKNKRTVFDLLDRLCAHHHDLKTREGWALEDGSGKRAFVSPDDPRHPRHAGPLAAA